MPYALVPQKRVERFEERIAPDIPDYISWIGKITASGDYLIWAINVEETDIPRRFRITWEEALALEPTITSWYMEGIKAGPDT